MSDLPSRGSGPEPLPTTSLGHYKIRAKIGSGGMGDVYDALHTGLNKRVAIKTLRKRYLDDEIVVQRFLREGQLASRIRHPNIVDVTDVGMMGGLPCLVMEHLEGESFSATIRREGRLPLDAIVDTLLPIIAAVDFAHDHGIVHRDLKPSNIFLAKSWNGEIVSKVLDFGISKLVHDAEQAALTTDSAFVGTPHYASPELMRADKAADGRSDQYSMGVILYEAVTGVRPFADLGNNFVALAMAICKGEFPGVLSRNPAVSPAFERVIARAMSLHPQDRFLTMRALGDALLPFASERARVIWGPTFRGHSGVAEAAAPARLSAPQSASTIATTIPSKPPFSTVTPVAPAAAATPRIGVPPGSVPPRPSGPPTPMSNGYPHQSSPPSSPPASYGAGAGPSSFPSGTPPGAAFDRLPSYGAGTSVPPLAQQRSRGSGVITAVIGISLGVAILASVILLRTSHRIDDSAVKVLSQPSELFMIDVQVTPATAAIEIDGAPAGAGRIARSLPRGKKHQLRATAPGYESLVIDFDENLPPPSVIGLRAAAASPNASASANTAVGASAGGDKGGHGKPTPGGKVKDRPKTDNIDPWE